MLINLRDYNDKYNLTYDNVLHVGAHEAQELKDYISFGAKKIHWIEANRIQCEKLKRKLNSKINIVTCAVISDKVGDEVEFKKTNNGQSSSILELGQHKDLYPKIVVKEREIRTTTTIDEICNFDHVNFLSIDIQGAELLALKGAKLTLPKVDAIVLEINLTEVYKGCALVDEIDSYLNEFNFQRVATGLMKNQPWGDALYIKTK